MDKLHYLIFLLIGVSLFVSGLAVATVQGAYDQRDVKLEESVNGILLNIKALNEVDETHQEAMELQANQTAELRNETKQTFDLFQNEIVKIKNDIRNKFPQAANVEEEEQTAISETPFLTLTIEKTEWILGDTLVFIGAAHPSDLVSITIKLPDRTLLQGTALPGDIVNGMYRIEIATHFDHAPGTWTVFAKQGREQSTTLIFKVE